MLPRQKIIQFRLFFFCILEKKFPPSKNVHFQGHLIFDTLFSHRKILENLYCWVCVFQTLLASCRPKDRIRPNILKKRDYLSSFSAKK